MDGDGDALDVIVLSQSTLKRGSVVKIQIIGMIKMKDKGRVDNKILSASIDLEILTSQKYRYVNYNVSWFKEILSIWFSNYKGEKIKIEGFEDKKLLKTLFHRHKNSMKIKDKKLKRYERKWVFNNIDYNQLCLLLYRSNFKFIDQFNDRHVNSIYFDDKISQLSDKI